MKIHAYSQFIRFCILPWVSVLTPSDFWRSYKIFRKDCRNTIYSNSQDVMLRKPQDVVSHAYIHVSFYHERMKSLNFSQDSLTTFEAFRKFPPTTNSDITVNFHDSITSSAQNLKPWRYVSTSATIERLTAIQDFRKRDWLMCSYRAGCGNIGV